MKTIYLNGVMLDRCSEFVGMLARRFQVAAPGLELLRENPDLQVINALTAVEKRSADDVQARSRNMERHSAELMEQVRLDLTSLGLASVADQALASQEVRKDLVTRTARVLDLEDGFRRFHAAHPVDMVISGSDYGSHSRSVVMAAKELGVPTLNIEHGFYFMRADWDLADGPGYLPTLFLSDFANLDNGLEKEVLSREADSFPHLETRFLDLGTPVDTVFDPGLDAKTSAAALGLQEGRIRVLMLGTWIEARAMNSMVMGQADIIDTYEDVIRSLAGSENGHKIDLIIKVHPVDAHPEVFPGVKAGLEKMATSCGLPIPLVLNDRLSEALAACDGVITQGFSSVLLDVFHRGKPAVVFLPPFLVPTGWANGEKKRCVPLRENMVTVAMNGKEAWDQVLAGMQPKNQEAFRQARAELIQKYNLEYQTVSQKSEKIVNWLEEYLET